MWIINVHNFFRYILLSSLLTTHERHSRFMFDGFTKKRVTDKMLYQHTEKQRLYQICSSIWRHVGQYRLLLQNSLVRSLHRKFRIAAVNYFRVIAQPCFLRPVLWWEAYGKTRAVMSKCSAGRRVSRCIQYCCHGLILRLSYTASARLRRFKVECVGVSVRKSFTLRRLKKVLINFGVVNLNGPAQSRFQN
jgi:hypothetical protein